MSLLSLIPPSQLIGPFVFVLSVGLLAMLLARYVSSNRLDRAMRAMVSWTPAVETGDNFPLNRVRAHSRPLSRPTKQAGVPDAVNFEEAITRRFAIESRDRDVEILDSNDVEYVED